MRLLTSFFLLCLLTNAWTAPSTLDIKANGQKVSLPYWPALHKPKGSILIIFGDSLVYGLKSPQELARLLAQQGWSAAIINTHPSDDKNNWVTQIPDTMLALKRKDNNRQIILHYGAKLSVTLAYFAKPQSKKANGLVLVSAYDKPIQKDLPDLLKKIKYPVFDVVGQFDYDDVLEQAKIRRDSMGNGNTYKFLVVPGARHQYWFATKSLVDYLHGWMMDVPTADDSQTGSEDYLSFRDISRTFYQPLLAQIKS